MSSASARKRNSQNSDVHVEKSSDEVTIVKVVASLVLGVGFGIAVEKGRGTVFHIQCILKLIDYVDTRKKNDIDIIKEKKTQKNLISLHQCVSKRRS